MRLTVIVAEAKTETWYITSNFSLHSTVKIEKVVTVD